jgi:integrase
MATQMATPHGEVGIEIRAGHYRLRLPRAVAEGSRRYISTGLRVGAHNERRVKIAALEIEDDIQKGTLDLSLESYAHKFERSPQVLASEPTLNELWDLYAIAKKPQVSRNTWAKEYDRKYRRRIAKLPQRVSDSPKVMQALLKDYTQDGVKRTLTQLSGCIEWSMQMRLIPGPNDYKRLAASLKSPRGAHKRRKVDPFNPSEQAAILAAFDALKPHYAPYVRFMLWTGARPGEATALTIEDYDRYALKIAINKSYDPECGLSPATKQGDDREFPCNEQLALLLDDAIARAKKLKTKLIFPAPRGGYLSESKFCNQVWRGCRNGAKHYTGIMPALIEQGLVISYRPPKNCRITFCSNMITAGFSAAQVCKLVGNSEAVLMKYYVSSSLSLNVPEF